MKFLGLFQKNKPVSFGQFRDMVRLEVRRNSPGIRVENTENGFIISLDGAPIACNLRNLYASYSKNPSDRNELINRWLNSLITEVPEQTWVEARMTLRPVLKSEENLERARKSLQKAETPDSLPAEPFAGDISAIVMREVGGTLTGVTQNQLETWSVSFEEAMHEALNNMNMLSFPPIINVLVAGGSAKDKGPEVGLVFEGDHMTATWLRMDRFRDHLAMRLESDYVVSIPARNRLVAVRSDEPGLISSLQMSNRNYYTLPYALTGKLFHISVATTGGVVSVYELGSRAGQGRAPAVVSKAAENTTFFPNAPAPPKNLARDLNNYWGLTEPTGAEVTDSGGSKRKG